MQESITTLPTEVIEEVMSYMSRDDIASLAQVSRRLWQVSATRLRSVIPLLASKKMRICIQHLADDPQRAAQTLEIHLSELIPREERRKPSPWRFNTIRGPFVAALERMAPLPFVPVGNYVQLGRIFEGALCNMAHLRTLVVHSRQHVDIWMNQIIIPSLCEIFVHPGAETPFLWQWAMRQDSITTLRNCWHYPLWSPRLSSSPPISHPAVFPKLQTLITNPIGAAEILPKSIVSDLTVHGIAIWPFMHWIVHANKRTPLRRITLSGAVEGICSTILRLQSGDSLPLHVRVFCELENWISDQDLVRSYPEYKCIRSEVSSSVQLVHPKLNETIRTLTTLERLEVYKRPIGPDYPDPAVVLPAETASMEMSTVNAWASTCIMLRVVRFPSNSKWVIHRKRGNPPQCTAVQ